MKARFTACLRFGCYPSRIHAGFSASTCFLKAGSDKPWEILCCQTWCKTAMIRVASEMGVSEVGVGSRHLNMGAMHKSTYLARVG